MRWYLVLLVAVLISTTGLLASGLDSIRQEPNLERRSQLAMEYANKALDKARDAYQGGNLEQTQMSLADVGASVDLAFASLDETGKDARRNPKFFKRAELSTHELLRRLESFADSMSFEDRPFIDKVHDRVTAVHDDLLRRIMGKKKDKE